MSDDSPRPRLACPKPQASTRLLVEDLPPELLRALQDVIEAYRFLDSRDRAGEFRLHGFHCPGKPFGHIVTVSDGPLPALPKRTP